MPEVRHRASPAEEALDCALISRVLTVEHLHGDGLAALLVECEKRLVRSAAGDVNEIVHHKRRGGALPLDAAALELVLDILHDFLPDVLYADDSHGAPELVDQ